MDLSSYYRIGIIAKPHGLKGEVTIVLEPNFPEDFSLLETVFVQQKENLVPHFITETSVKGNKAYTKFEDVDTIEQAQALAKCNLFMPKSARTRTQDDVLLIEDVLGFTVEDSEAGVLGEVTDIVQGGLQRLLAIKAGEREILIPLNGPFIDSVQEDTRKITVTLPSGFLEI